MKPASFEHAHYGTSTMHVLCYSSREDSNSAKLKQALETFQAETLIEWYSSTEDLQGRLRSYNGRRTIALVSAATEKDLVDLFFIQHLLRRAMIVLLLPNTERHTIAMGHRLQPYFMCTSCTDVSQLAEVFRNIVACETPPQPVGQFRNPFESIMSCRPADTSDHLTPAA
jgi:hypothetical protein